MAKKQDIKDKTDESSLWPYMSQFKAPRWAPFQFQKNISPVALPRYDYLVQLCDLLQNFIFSQKNCPISSIYWYLLLKRYLRLSLNAHDEDFFNRIMTYEVITPDFIGFKANSLDQAKKGKEFELPDLQSTFYALNSMQILGRLTEYLQLQSEGNKRNFILNYIEKAKKGNQYHHCWDPSCQICKKNPAMESLYYVMLIYEILGSFVGSIPKEILSTLKNTQNAQSELYRLICLQFLGSKDFVKEEHIIAFSKYQKTGGGFTFQNSAFPDIQDSFWIGYLLYTYQWLVPYPSGALFSYLVSEIRKLDATEIRTEKHIREFSQIVVLLVTIWDHLTDELETLIFQNIVPPNVLDLSVLSIQGGVAGAEPELLLYINSKYNFKLELQDNAILFRRFLNKLDPFQQRFAKKIYESAEKYSQFDLTEIRLDYNKGRPRKTQIADEFLINLVQQMVKEYFFHGKVFKKGIFARYYFSREDFVEKIIVCDRPVSLNDINKEKARLKEVKDDIFNMTREMESSAENIYREIESYILAGEVELAEERLKSNIKKALFDASFFNKNIEAFQQEFLLIKAKEILVPFVSKWQDIFNRLQQDFNNVHNILIGKIKDLQEELAQRKSVLSLEEMVNSKINTIADQFDTFAEQFRLKLEAEYTRPGVKELEQIMIGLEGQVIKCDQEIGMISSRIKSKVQENLTLRKKSIDHWISQQEEFHNMIHFYREGFHVWAEKLNQLDVTHKNFASQIDEIGKKVSNAVQNNQFDQAYEINNNMFPRILEDINRVALNLKSELDPLMKKSRKLNSLFRTIQTEWLLYQNVLQKLIHQMQQELANSIQNDQKWSLKEDFRLLVEKAEIEVREKMVNFEKHINSLLQQDPHLIETTIPKDLKEIQSQFSQYDTEIKQLSSPNFDKMGEYANDGQVILDNWQKFKVQYQQELDLVTEKINDEKIINGVLQYTKSTKSNIVPLEKIASKLEIDPIKMDRRLRELIASSRINATLNTTTSAIEVHNEEWRQWERLKQFKEVIIREMQSNSEKTQSFFEKAIDNNEILRNIAQFKALAIVAQQKVMNTLDQYNDYLKEHDIHVDYDIIKKEDEIFRQCIEFYKTQSQTLMDKCDKTIEHQSLIQEQLTFLEEMVHSEIYRINNSLTSRNLENYKRNLKWFEEQREIIQKGIQNIQLKVEQTRDRIWNGVIGVTKIMTMLQQAYDEKKMGIIQFFDNSCNDILEKLSYSQLNTMRQRMEGIIKQKEDQLNSLLTKYEQDIKAKIHIKEFKEAARKIVEKSKVLEQELKLIEKEIKTVNKTYDNQSKIFGIKHRYLIEQWELFLLDFLNNLHEKELLMQMELVENYVKYVVKALRGKYIPIKMISDDLLMKHEYTTNRLIGLIGENRLPGQIDLNYDIYFESPSQLDPQTIASLDLIKATNVRAYLSLQRLGNILKLLGPIIAAAGSLIGLSVTLQQYFESPYVWLSPIIVIGLIVLILWLRKGRERVVPKVV